MKKRSLAKDRKNGKCDLQHFVPAPVWWLVCRYSSIRSFQTPDVGNEPIEQRTKKPSNAGLNLAGVFHYVSLQPELSTNLRAIPRFLVVERHKSKFCLPGLHAHENPRPRKWPTKAKSTRLSNFGRHFLLALSKRETLMS